MNKRDLHISICYEGILLITTVCSYWDMGKKLSFVKNILAAIPPLRGDV